MTSQVTGEVPREVAARVGVASAAEPPSWWPGDAAGMRAAPVVGGDAPRRGAADERGRLTWLPADATRDASGTRDAGNAGNAGDATHYAAPAAVGALTASPSALPPLPVVGRAGAPPIAPLLPNASCAVDEGVAASWRAAAASAGLSSTDLPSARVRHAASMVRDAEELAAAHFNATRYLLSSELRVLDEEAREAREAEAEAERDKLARERARAADEAHSMRLAAEREVQARLAEAEAQAAALLRQAACSAPIGGGARSPRMLARADAQAQQQRKRLQRAQRTSGAFGGSDRRGDDRRGDDAAGRGTYRV